MTHPPLPPFSETTATQKVRAAEDGWNSRNPQLVTQAYTDASQWRNRSEFISGHAEIEAFLTGSCTTHIASNSTGSRSERKTLKQVRKPAEPDTKTKVSHGNASKVGG